MNCDSDMCGNPAGALDTTTAEKRGNRRRIQWSGSCLRQSGFVISGQKHCVSAGSVRTVKAEFFGTDVDATDRCCRQRVTRASGEKFVTKKPRIPILFQGLLFLCSGVTSRSSILHWTNSLHLHSCGQKASWTHQSDSCGWCNPATIGRGKTSASAAERWL